MWVFRDVRKRQKAKDLIQYYSESGRNITHGTATGKYTILCADCDSWLGTTVDEYAKHWVINAHKISSNIDTDALRLARFIASVFWRASLSKHWMYRNFLTGQNEITALLKDTTYDKNKIFEIGTYSLKRLVEPGKRFSKNSRRDILIVPFSKLLHSENTEQPILSMRMVFEGFIWNMAIPKAASSPRQGENNFLDPAHKKYTPAHKNIFNDPDVADWIMNTYGKKLRKT